MDERNRVWQQQKSFWQWWYAHPVFIRNRGSWSVGPAVTQVQKTMTFDMDKVLAQRDSDIYAKYQHLQSWPDALLIFVPY
jgi:hypothetical protein